MIFVASVEILAAGLVVKLTALITSPDVANSHDDLILYSLICVGIFAIKGMLALLDNWFQGRWVQNFLVFIKHKLIRRYTKMDYAHQIIRNSGESLSVLFSDVDVYIRMGLTALGIFLTEILVLFVLLGFLLYIELKITFILIFLLGTLSYVTLRFLLPVFRKWGKIAQNTAKRGYQEGLQILQSYRDILIFGKTEYFIERYMKQARLRASVNIKTGVSQVIPRTGIELVFIIFFAGIVITYSMQNADFSTLMLTLSAYLYAGFRLLPGLNRMIIQMNNIKMADASLERVISEMTSPLLEKNYVSAPDLSFNKTIQISNVSYQYPETQRVVLSNITLEIKKGEFLGILGKTGSGKSTLLSLILGLINPTEGQITVDGEYPVNTPNWHQKIGYTAQNFDLIDGTLLDNIAFGVPEEDRDQKRIKKAISDAQLDSFIEKLPEGTSTYIGERGVRISGGERQRVALARALYTQPEVLMLDEATSALDIETEASIMETIKALRNENLTIITITHRPETLKNADRVIEIRDGKLLA
jgi:ATP-binding cassette subfamily C protein